MNSPDQNVFQNTLSDFTFEAACGGAIRHLADSGFTAKQIMERLDYPISGERVRKALYKHLCDTLVILEKSPEEELPEAKSEYILEYDSYGKPSYRRKSTEGDVGNLSGSDAMGTMWREIAFNQVSGPAKQVSGNVPEKVSGEFGKGILKRIYRNSKVFRYSEPGGSEKLVGYPGPGAELSAFLTGKCSQEQEEAVYISCDFGIPGSAAARGVSLLNGRQQEYLEGIPWPRHRVYHRLDHRMKEILCSLYEQHAYEGICYFLSGKEKLLISDISQDTGVETANT